MSPEVTLKSQIHCLRHEIADRSAEIQRLESISRGLRSTYLHSPGTPRHPSKSPSPGASPLAPATENGVDENRLGVRSASTTRMITTLQKEMDALKASSEAARAAADAERASREAIQRKCQKLEEVVEMLRMENANVNGLLTRKERIMKQEIESRQALETSLSTLTSEKSDLQSQIQKIQQRLESVEAALANESALRAKADIEYTALRTQVNQSSEKSRTDLAALRQGIQTLKRERKEDARTMQLMAGELDRLKGVYEKEKEEGRGIVEEIEGAREKQRVAFERALRGLRKELEEQALGNEENVLRTGEALAELRALNGKIRAVDPDLR